MEFDQWRRIFDDEREPTVIGSVFGAEDDPRAMPSEPAPPGFVWTYRTRGCTEPGGGIVPIHSWGLDRVGDVGNAKDRVKQSIQMAYGDQPWAVGFTKCGEQDAVRINTQTEEDALELRRFFGSHVDGVVLVIAVIGEVEPQSAPSFGDDGWWWWHTGRRVGLPYRRRRRGWGRRWGWWGPSAFGQYRPSFGDDDDTAK